MKKTTLNWRFLKLVSILDDSGHKKPPAKSPHQIPTSLLRKNVGPFYIADRRGHGWPNITIKFEKGTIIDRLNGRDGKIFLADDMVR